jgi:hypothetical protein
VTVATYSLTTSPIMIDDGTSYSVLVTNTGAATVELSRGGRLRPNQAQTVYPEGAALTAAAVTGTSSVSTSTTTKPLPNAADPAALAANAAFTGTYARVQTIVPSGDATGAADIAAINAALLTAGTIILRGNLTINAPIRIPSNTTLVLWESTVTLASASNCNIVQNYDQTATGNTNITIKGIGRASFNGNPTNQVRQSLAKTDGTGGTSLYNNVGLYFVQVAGLRVEDVQIGPTNAYAVTQYGVTNARWSRIRLEQDGSTTNQDGIDIGTGCSDITVEHIRGKSGDDGFAVHSITWWVSTAPDAVPPLYQVTGAAPNGRNTTRIFYRDIEIDAGINLLRLNSDSVSPLSVVEMTNAANTNTNGNGALLSIGSAGYVNATKTPSTTQLTDVRFINIQGGARFGAKTAISLDQSCSRIRVANVDLLSKAWPTALVGTGANNYSPTVSDVVIDGVTAAATGTTAVGDLVNFRSGSTVSDITLRNIKVAECQAILNNASALTNVTLRNISTGKAWRIPFNSATPETGDFSDVRVASLDAAVTKTYGAAAVAKLDRCPVVVSADTTPSSATKGSRIICDHTKDPTGGAGTTGGEYLASGSAWVKVVDLGASF